MRFSLKDKSSSPIKKYGVFFLFRLKGQAEEDIRFLFQVFYTAQCS
jgi:hypothetical protein